MAMPEQRMKGQLDAEAQAAKRLEAEKLENELVELAKLSLLEYETVRENKANELGVRVSALDKGVSAKRKCGAEARGRAITLYEPEPWHEPVSGAEALNDAAKAIRRHMVIRQEDADACALWCAHTYLYKKFDHTPRLMITAPTAECGKTVLMSHMVGNLVTKPQPVELMKPAPFFRLAEAYAPTFLIDEVDVFIKEDSELLAAVNNGWEPHGGVPRCVGDDNEVRLFSTHCPVAMAGITLHKKLPATTISRSIIINLERATIGEIADADIYDSKKHKKALLVIGRKFARWCGDNEKQIQHADPKLPNKVRNRLANKWGPLFAIAQVAGGDWSKRTEKALFAQQDMAEPSKSEQLLADTQRVVTDKTISTKELISRLSNLDDAPWSNYNFRERDDDRRHITDRQIAGLFKPYKIHSKAVRIGKDTAKGYRRSDMENAWKRYLPQDTPKIRVTGSQSSEGAGFSPNLRVTPENNVTYEKTLKPSQGAGCYPVTPKKGGDGANGYPPGLFDAAISACAGLKLTAGEFIARLEPCDYSDIITSPEVARATATSMDSQR